jgi:hypothetical protein
VIFFYHPTTKITKHFLPFYSALLPKTQSLDGEFCSGNVFGSLGILQHQEPQSRKDLGLYGTSTLLLAEASRAWVSPSSQLSNDGILGG